MICNPLSPTKWTQHPNSMVCWGGGGDKTTTTGVPSEFMPYITKQLDKLEALGDAGGIGNIADMDPAMIEALKMKEDAAAKGNMLTGKAEDALGVYEDQKNKTGIFGDDQYGLVQEQIKDQIAREQQGAMGGLRGQMSASGGLTSAKGEAMRESTMGNIAYDKTATELARQRTDALGGAGSLISSTSGITDSYMNNADALGDVGSYKMDYNQKVLDKDYDAIQKMFSVYGQTGKESNTTGGGK